MNENRICTIEINLDDDFANACAYHVDYLKETVKRNLLAASESREMQNWALIGLSNSLDEACTECDKLRQMLCKIHGKQPYGIEESLYKLGEKNEEIFSDDIKDYIQEFKEKIKEKFDLNVKIVMPKK